MLPIISHLSEVYKIWHAYHLNLPKVSRYGLGNKIDSALVDVLEDLFLAGALPREKKLVHVQRAVMRFDLLKFFLRIAWELKVLDNNKYLHLSSKLDEIGKMLGGWHKKLQKETFA